MENIYLAINIDGNAATAMAATKDENGMIVPIATETQVLKIEDTRNGMISLDGDVQLAISKLQKTLLNKMEGTNNEVKGLYLGVMPRSLHGESIEVRKDFDGKHRITNRDIDNMSREIAQKIENKIIRTCENGYVRDGSESKKVLDEIADTLVMKSLAVVVTPKREVNYADLMNSGTKLFGVLPTHMAIAKLVTDEDQRVNGIIAMHIGRQSTGMTYYCNDLVMATVVVPFGFDHATHDMALGEISDKQVENYLMGDKVKYDWGTDENLLVQFRRDENAPSFHIVRGFNAFNARMKEIFKLGHDRMAASLCMETINAPVVLTTATVNTDEFCKVMTNLIGREFVRGDVGCKLIDDKYANPCYIPLVSLINETSENCVVVKESVESEDEGPVLVQNPAKHEDKPGKKTDSFIDICKNLFSSEEDDQH